MLIRPTGLTLVKTFFWIVPMAARLIRLISIKTKEYQIWSPLWERSMVLNLLSLHVLNTSRCLPCCFDHTKELRGRVRRKRNYNLSPPLRPRLVFRVIKASWSFHTLKYANGVGYEWIDSFYSPRLLMGRPRVMNDLPTFFLLRFLFHKNCGQFIALDSNRTTARRVDSYNHGVVLSEKPLPDNHLFQVWQSLLFVIQKKANGSPHYGLFSSLFTGHFLTELHEC